jgi:Mce-associated membrane protein
MDKALSPPTDEAPSPAAGEASPATDETSPPATDEAAPATGEAPEPAADEAPSPATDEAAAAETAEAAQAADEAPARVPAAGARRWLSDPVFVTALVLVVLAAAFAGWAGLSWYSAAHAGPSASAQLRDRVLQAGEQAVQNFNTLDYRKVTQGLALWEQSSTGTLHDQIVAGHAQFARDIQQTKTVTTARILDGALTSLNARSGTANIIVAIQITVTPVKGNPVTKQSRLAGRLTRTNAGWKLSALGEVPVGAAAGSTGTGAAGG